MTKWARKPCRKPCWNWVRCYITICRFLMEITITKTQFYMSWGSYGPNTIKSGISRAWQFSTCNFQTRTRTSGCVRSLFPVNFRVCKKNLMIHVFYCILCECVRKVKLGSFNMKDLKVENSLMTVTEFEQNGLVQRKIVFLLMRLGGQRINLQVFILNKSFSKKNGKQYSF